MLITPNFWQSNKKLKGMHGYRDESVENHTCVLSNSEIISEYSKGFFDD